MNKNKGFTLIEMLVTIVFAAILGVITMPSMMSWYNKDKFIQQSRDILETIDDARANALSEKKCSDDDNSPSESWNFRWQAPRQFVLSCSYHDGENDETIFSLDENIAVNSNKFYYKNSTENDTEFDSSQKNIHIYFNSGDAQASISVQDSSLGQYDIKEVSLPFIFTGEEPLNRTICFNRIGGFPSIYSTKNCND